MALFDEITNKITAYSTDKFEIEETSIVPDTDNSKLTFGNKGLTGEYTFLFVDIRKSSSLSEIYGFEKAAKIYQSFHEINVKVVIENNGAVRAFDGDRIMGVFGSDFKNNEAVTAAMQIISAVRNVLNPILKTDIKCGAGIDYGKVLITKVGKGRNVNNNDLVWVGKANNYASHLSNEANNSVIISKQTYGRLNDSRKLANGTDIWTNKNITLKNNTIVNCYETSYEWNLPK